jgi:hypothetical protein
VSFEPFSQDDAKGLRFKISKSFSGELAALLLYSVIPKTDRLVAAAAAGKPGRFSFLERSNPLSNFSTTP